MPPPSLKPSGNRFVGGCPERCAAGRRARFSVCYREQRRCYVHGSVCIHKTLRTLPATATAVTARLWEIGDIVNVLETWEATATLSLPPRMGGPAMKRALIMVLAIFVFVLPAHSECICQCVDGHMQPLCSSSIDLPPICPPTICPIMSPSIVPINPPTIPPIGTSSCRQARVCDTFGNCQWQQVCR